MNFVSIAFQNVRKKFGSYFIFFVSITFAVLIFHLFATMYYNPELENFRFGTGKMSTLFKGSAIAVLCFSSIFVFYSGNYFIKMQKKEIAIYSLLGMKKIHIALMMFWETFFLGILAIATGVLLGYLLSGVSATLLFRFMAIGTKVSLFLEPRAIMTTILAFVILFAINGIRAYRTIYRYRLIDLLSATKQTEGVPGYSVLGAILSVVLLLAGYIYSLTIRADVSGFDILPSVCIAAVLVLVGTFLLFRNFIPAFIAFLKKRKGLYYRTGNYISISQIAFRLKANSNMLSVIALLTALTITIISAAFSFYTVLSDDGTRCYSPFSFLAKNITEEQHEALLQAVTEVGDVQIIGEDQIHMIKVTIQNDNYSVFDQADGELGLGDPAEGYLMSESMYLKIIEETGAKEGSYSEMYTDFHGGLDDTSCYFIDGNAISDYCINLPGQDANVTLGGETTAYTISASGQHKYLGALDTYKRPTVVVSDTVYDNYLKNVSSEDIDIFYGFLFDDNMMSERTVDRMCELIPDRFDIGGLPGNMSYIGVYKANFALFGSYTFIGFFVGSLFLLSSGSVLYYKLIMEAQEEAPRYTILRKTGMSMKEILSSILKQLGMVYGFPLIIGLVHTLFGLLFYAKCLGEMSTQTPTLQNAFLFVALFILVYGAFYIMSVRSYYQIVKHQIA